MGQRRWPTARLGFQASPSNEEESAHNDEGKDNPVNADRVSQPAARRDIQAYQRLLYEELEWSNRTYRKRDGDAQVPDGHDQEIKLRGDV
jgi:hypothetical protein